MENIKHKINLRNELIRKSIHLSSSVIPISYYFLDRNIEIIALTILCFLMFVIDFVRVKNEVFKNIYLKYLSPILRSHEVDNKTVLFTGGTYIVVAYLICVIIFPKPIAITSMFIVIFSDTAAAIFGKVYGKHFINSKTIEGSLAFFFTGVVLILITPKMTSNINEYYVGIFAMIVTTFFELIPNKIDDNISIPIFFGLIYLLLLKIFL